MKKITMILAVAQNGVIGKNNTLVWKLKKDLQNFKELTSGGVVIMGRKTFESFPKPLPNRTHIVISRNSDFLVPEGHYVVNSLHNALEKALQIDKPVFIIGGGEIYKQSISIVDEIILTYVYAQPEGDTFFDLELLDNFKLVSVNHFKADETNEFDFDIKNYSKV